MTNVEYVEKVKNLERQLMTLTSEYVSSNQIYKIDDILEVSFDLLSGRHIVVNCKIYNVYPAPTNNFATNFCNWPKGELVYFARFVSKDSSGNLNVSSVCPLGELSQREQLCGYMLNYINKDSIKIRVIEESEVKVLN